MAYDKTLEEKSESIRVRLKPEFKAILVAKAKAVGIPCSQLCALVLVHYVQAIENGDKSIVLEL